MLFNRAVHWRWWFQCCLPWAGAGKSFLARFRDPQSIPASWKAQPDPHPCAGDSAIDATNRGKQTNEALGLNLAVINI